MLTNSPKSNQNENKIANSGIRVLELLKALTNSELTTQDILQLFENKTHKIYRKEVVAKYINTIKLIGINIGKEKDCYFLAENLRKMDFSYTDISTLKFIKNYAQKTKQEELNNNIEKAIKTIESYFSQKTKNIISSRNNNSYVPQIKKDKRHEKIKIVEKYCQEGLKLNIKYKNYSDESTKEYKISPIKLIFKNNQSILIAYDCVANEYKEFLLDLITEVQQTPQKIITTYPTSVIFKLKGRLAKSYILKNDEKILESCSDYIVVSATNINKEKLIHRLIRYFDCCEILYPKDCRDKMINLLNDMEKMYL